MIPCRRSPPPTSPARSRCPHQASPTDPRDDRPEEHDPRDRSLRADPAGVPVLRGAPEIRPAGDAADAGAGTPGRWNDATYSVHYATAPGPTGPWTYRGLILTTDGTRSEEHTSELPSLMRISYAVFCLKNNSIV